MLPLSVVVIFCLCMIFAIVSDMLTMTIANSASIVLVASFAALALLGDLAWQDYALHIALGAVVLALTFCLFAVNAMGGGDAKMIAATAVWMGPGLPLLQYLIWSALLGGVLTLVLLALRYSPLAAPASSTRLFRHVADRKAGIPYGIALGIAGLLAFPSSPLGAWALAQM